MLRMMMRMGGFIFLIASLATSSVLYGADSLCSTGLRKVAYYAHPLSTYNTAQEARDIEIIKALGVDVLNPNGPEHNEGYLREGMPSFVNLIRARCHLLCFRAFPDGSIPAGIAKEIEAMDFGPVIELPSAINRRTLSVQATRAFLREGGFR